ncbi:MAG: YceI family protein [Actinobacteria bacterium]|nr:YceI family protein [Actinomycetota bacterium]
MSQVYTESTQAPTLPSGRWQVDPAHSSIEFGIKHLLITTVKGKFGEFEGIIEVAEDGSAHASASVRSESIDTHEPQRDGHLRSPDFFDADRFPEIQFESSRIENVEGNRFRVRGDLSIRDATQELELEAELTGSAVDPWGNERIGLVLRGQLNPNDYGVDWNQELESGGNLLGDRVDIVVDVSALKGS